MSVASVSVPTAYRAFAESSDQRVMVIHPALRTRIPEVFLADMLASASEEENAVHYVVVAPNVDRLEYRFTDWCASLGRKASKRLGAYVYGRATIWFKDASAAGTIPVDAFARILIADAHLIGPDVARSLLQRTHGRVRVTGCLADRLHWSYRFQDESTCFRVSASEVVAAFPDQAAALEEAGSRFDRVMYRRMIGLEDVDVSSMFGSFKRFATERLFIRDKQANIIPFTVTSTQETYLAHKRIARALAKKNGHPVRILVLKSRREGITTLEQGLTYQDAATRYNRMNVTLAHLAESTRRIFEIARLMQERDPFAPPIDGPGNQTKIHFPTLNSSFFIGTAGSVGFGRGDTLQRVHGSEVSKWCKGPRQQLLVSDLVAGLTEAASHGEVTLETTADGVEWFCNTWNESKRGLNSWYRIFLPWFMSRFNRAVPGTFSETEIRDTLSDEEKELIRIHRLDFAQIAWRRGKIRDLKGLFKQEYPEDDVTCFLTSGTMYFDLDSLELLARAIAGAPSPARVEKVPGGLITYWELPKKGLTYAAGTDTSEGLPGCDENGTFIVERTTGRHVASVYGLLSMADQAKYGVRLCHEYNDCLWGIERNNTSGGAVIERVRGLGYKNLYRFKGDRDGWSTDSLTRPIVLDNLRQFIIDHPLLDGVPVLRSSELVSQLMTFKLQSGGSYAADSNCKDDAVLAAAIAHEMRVHAGRRPRITVAGGTGNATSSQQPQGRTSDRSDVK